MRITSVPPQQRMHLMCEIFFRAKALFETSKREKDYGQSL